MRRSPNARQSRVVRCRDAPPAVVTRMVRFSDGLDATHRSAAPLSDTAAELDATAPEPVVRRALHHLRIESERRRSVHDAPIPMLDTLGDSASDPLVRLLAELRAVTTRYVVGLRADGAPPEQMLVRVKAMVREALAAEGWHDPESTRSLIDAVVGWSIDAYYDR